MNSLKARILMKMFKNNFPFEKSKISEINKNTHLPQTPQNPSTQKTPHPNAQAAADSHPIPGDEVHHPRPNLKSNNKTLPKTLKICYNNQIN